jgi:hypothetical protein
MNFLSTTIIGANRSAGLLLGGFGMILAERERERERDAGVSNFYFYCVRARARKNQQKQVINIIYPFRRFYRTKRRNGIFLFTKTDSNKCYRCGFLSPAELFYTFMGGARPVQSSLFVKVIFNRFVCYHGRFFCFCSYPHYFVSLEHIVKSSIKKGRCAMT